MLVADRTFDVTLSGISLPGALGTPSTSSVMILEEAGLSFSLPNYLVHEEDGGITVTVHRLFDSSGPISVHYATSDGTAGSTDYTTTSGFLNWADGDPGDMSFTIPIMSDGLNEGNETFTLSLSAATGNAQLGTQSTAIVTIAKSNGAQAGFPFTDVDGDIVTPKLAGKLGTLTYYLTNGTGPTAELDPVGTSSTNSESWV